MPVAPGTSWAAGGRDNRETVANRHLHTFKHSLPPSHQGCGCPCRGFPWVGGHCSRGTSASECHSPWIWDWRGGEGRGGEGRGGEGRGGEGRRGRSRYYIA